MLAPNNAKLVEILFFNLLELPPRSDDTYKEKVLHKVVAQVKEISMVGSDDVHLDQGFLTQLRYVRTAFDNSADTNGEDQQASYDKIKASTQTETPFLYAVKVSGSWDWIKAAIVESIRLKTKRRMGSRSALICSGNFTALQKKIGG